MGRVQASSRQAEIEMTQYKNIPGSLPESSQRLSSSSRDPNLPVDQRESFESSSFDFEDDEVLIEKEVDDSPYPEVRAAVHNYDEDVPANTIRAWTIGMIMVIFGAAVNTLFSLRAPSISIGVLVAQIVAWPLGRGWATIMPTHQYETFGLKWSLNPGPFNIKEHSVIVIMANVSFGAAYATHILLTQVAFYKQDFGVLFQLILVISTQSIGYGIAGMLRKFLVYPAAMIWPSNLVNVTLMNVMYETKDRKDPTIVGGSIPRYRWFAYICIGAFFYYFIPGFLAQFLSIYAFATWIAPENVIVNQLFGGTTGLSIIPLTFDWAQITGFVRSPLVPPWHAIANTLIGVVTFYIFGASMVHYTGMWSAKYLPMSDSATYDNTGAIYNVTRILTPDFTLDLAAYKAYSPLFLSTTFALSYGLSFAAITSLVVYVFLNHGTVIWRQFRNSSNEEPDIHMRMMSKYVETPSWWYLALFIVMIGLSLFTILAYPTHLEWWAFALALAISFAFSLPIGIVQAITNIQIGLNVLTEFVFGYIQPGRPLALMLFKTYGYITMSQALSFVSDLKFGHYMKIPPRTMFSAQVAATTVSCFVQVTVINFALANIKDVCTLDQEDHFTCPGGRVFFSASVIWGLIGPERIFSPGQVYSGLFWFFGVGFITPILVYFAARKWPNSAIKYIMVPLIFGGAAEIPPATPLNYLSWGIVGYVFQKVIRQRHFGWWSRFNYLTSSGLDLGLALSTLFIFFALTLNNIRGPNWWGNTISKTTLDAQHKAVQAVVSQGQTFGPDVW